MIDSTVQSAVFFQAHKCFQGSNVSRLELRFGKVIELRGTEFELPKQRTHSGTGGFPPPMEGRYYTIWFTRLCHKLHKAYIDPSLHYILLPKLLLTPPGLVRYWWVSLKAILQVFDVRSSAAEARPAGHELYGGKGGWVSR